MIDIYAHLTPEERLDKAAAIIAIGLLRLAAKKYPSGIKDEKAKEATVTR
jgi:hypothetical protein